MSDKIVDPKVGDKFTRMLAGVMPMEMIVTKVGDSSIICQAVDGPDGYEFDLATGAEIDTYLQWGTQWGVSGSFIRRPE